DFYEGLAPVAVKDKWGYIDKTGYLVIDMQFDRANRFSEGLAQVEFRGRHGFVDRTGKFAIEPKYFGAGMFSEGMAPVAVRESTRPMPKQVVCKDGVCKEVAY
ncbi:MAG: WG repeat-containing protein, partial [Burkholderiales bacterium]